MKTSTSEAVVRVSAATLLDGLEAAGVAPEAMNCWQSGGGCATIVVRGEGKFAMIGPGSYNWNDADQSEFALGGGGISYGLHDEGDFDDDDGSAMDNPIEVADLEFDTLTKTLAVIAAFVTGKARP